MRLPPIGSCHSRSRDRRPPRDRAFAHGFGVCLGPWRRVSPGARHVGFGRTGLYCFGSAGEEAKD